MKSDFVYNQGSYLDRLSDAFCDQNLWLLAIAPTLQNLSPLKTRRGLIGGGFSKISLCVGA